MKTLLTAILALNLIGCAAYWDRQDPCQSRGQVNYKYPSFCGASGSGGYVTRDYYTNRPVYKTNRY